MSPCVPCLMYICRVCGFILRTFRSMMQGCCDCLYQCWSGLMSIFRSAWSWLSSACSWLRGLVINKQARYQPVSQEMERFQRQERYQEQVQRLCLENQDLTKEVHNLKGENRQLYTEKENALTRLSEVMSLNLRDNNPNIADLSDDFRPTKLAEISSELYDNEWTSAFEQLQTTYNITDREAVQFLLDSLMEAYKICKQKHEEEWRTIYFNVFGHNPTPSKGEVKMIKDMRKKNAKDRLAEIEKICLSELKRVFLEKSRYFSENLIHAYISSCVKLSWMMQFQDPPVTFYCPDLTGSRDPMVSGGAHARKGMDGTGGLGGLGLEMGEYSTKLAGKRMEQASFTYENEMEKRDEAEQEGKPLFDKGVFREYTKSGKYIEYIVWPAMFLHNGGPLLSKGVAQGCDWL